MNFWKLLRSMIGMKAPPSVLGEMGVDEAIGEARKILPKSPQRGDIVPIPRMRYYPSASFRFFPEGSAIDTHCWCNGCGECWDCNSTGFRTITVSGWVVSVWGWKD